MKRALVLGAVCALAACGDRGGDGGGADETDGPGAASGAEGARAASAGAAPVAGAGAARVFGDWAVSCDNVGDCTAFGFGPEQEASGAFIQVERRAGGGASPVLRVSTGEPEEAPAGDPGEVRIAVDGPRPASAALPRITVDAPSGFLGQAEGETAMRLLNAAGDGRSVQVSVAGMAPRRVSLDGAAAALLWMDERQGRAGTPTALRARGDKPAGSVPGPRPIPVVTAAKAEARRAGALPRPAGLLARPEVKACREDSGEPVELIAEPLGARANLYGVPCYSGAYNAAFRFFVSDADGKNLRPAPIEGLGPDEDGTLMNADFEAGAMKLSEFSKGRGVGDCGVDRAWTWDGGRFRLTHDSRMELCRGLAPGLWPVLHRAEVR